MPLNDASYLDKLARTRPDLLDNDMQRMSTGRPFKNGKPAWLLPGEPGYVAPDPQRPKRPWHFKKKHKIRRRRRRVTTIQLTEYWQDNRNRLGDGTGFVVKISRTNPNVQYPSRSRLIYYDVTPSSWRRLMELAWRHEFKSRVAKHRQVITIENRWVTEKYHRWLKDNPEEAARIARLRAENKARKEKRDCNITPPTPRHDSSIDEMADAMSDAIELEGDW